MGESFVFQMGGLIFKWKRGWGAPWGPLVLVGGFSKKIVRWGGCPPPLPPTMGNLGVMDLFLSWVMVSVKKVSFPAKTTVQVWPEILDIEDC